MALKLTVYISDQDGQTMGLESAPQDELNRLADRLLYRAEKHQSFYLSRVGDAVFEEDER